MQNSLVGFLHLKFVLFDLKRSLLKNSFSPCAEIATTVNIFDQHHEVSLQTRKHWSKHAKSLSSNQKKKKTGEQSKRGVHLFKTATPFVVSLSGCQVHQYAL
jgi:hypothetical protein